MGVPSGKQESLVSLVRNQIHHIQGFKLKRPDDVFSFGDFENKRFFVNYYSYPGFSTRFGLFAIRLE
jgi:hypothetical protein